MSTPDVEVITYGGGDLLRMVFNAVSMLFYGNDHNDSLVHPMCAISAMIGCSWGISRCFFQSYADAFLTKYFLPLIAIPSFLMVPQTRVHIIDKLEDKAIVVDHVPFLFAKIAGLSSFWGYQMTQAIEDVMHTPNDAKYSKTGMLFGADTALDFSRLKLNNGTVAQNLHHFTQQCIIYDIALGRYTIDKLKNTSNLLQFLKENTSKVRMIPYVDPNSNTTEFFSCLEAVEKMGVMFDRDVEYYTKHEVLKNIPIAYQTLMTFQTQNENKIANQLSTTDLKGITKNIIAVNSVEDAMQRFAVERAKDNQRSIYQTAGAMAGSTLVTMRMVFEALIYASCAIILPLSLLPGGIRFIGSWIFLNIWIQLWPPLYGILNYITMLCAQKYASSVLGGITDGYSLFTSVGLQDLAHDTAAIAGYLSLSVPVLSFYILQNLQSMAHLGSSLLSPLQSATSTAGAELSSGNYSYANTSLGQISYNNQTAFQQNTAPSLSAGYFTDNHGTHQIKYGQDHLTVNQDPSNLNTSISTAEAYSQSLQNSLQVAETQVESKSNLYTETRGLAERSIADMVQHVSSSESFTNGYSSSETQGLQESANYVANMAESWGSQHGLSGRESLEYFASLGLDWPIGIHARAGHNENSMVSSEEARQSAENILNSKDFQEHYQNVLNCTQSEATNEMTDEGKRYVENYASSIERLQSAQEQVSNSYNSMNQISDNLNYVQSNSSTVNTNLNTEFSNWLHERNSLGTLFDKTRQDELNCLRDSFISEKCQSDLGSLNNFSPPSSSLSDLPDLEGGWSQLQTEARERANDQGLSFGQLSERGEGLASQYDSMQTLNAHKISEQHQQIDNTQQNLKGEFDRGQQESLLNSLNSRIKNNSSSIKDNFREHIISSHENSSLSWFDSYSNP